MQKNFIHKIFESQVNKTPASIAVIFEGQSLTFSDLNNRANQLAVKLIEEGVSPDKFVGICLERSIDLIIGVLGVLKAGGACLPLDINYPEDRLSFMLEDSEVDLILVQKSTDKKITKTGAKKILIDELDYDFKRIENPSVVLIPENLIYLIYTSGSTGNPKGVKMPHKSIYNLIQWQNKKSTPGVWKTLQFSPISFDVSFQEIFSTLTSGSTLVLLKEEIRKDPINLLKFIFKEEIERIFLPYIALQNLSEAALFENITRLKLHHVITAGEQLKITPQIISLFQRLDNAVLHNQYGPSETHVITAYELNGNPSSWPELPPIGKPIDNANVLLLNDNLMPVAPDQVGEMYLGGECLALGYYKRDDLTNSRFIKINGEDEKEKIFYKSGDLGKINEEGNLEFLGRNDDQIKIRGFRIEPGEIENMISKLPGIKNNVIALKEINGGRKVLVSYIVTDEETIDIHFLKEYLKNHLPDYMIPNYFIKVSSFPITPSGKIDKKSLPLPGISTVLETQNTKQILPDNLEEKLSNIWKELLNIDEVRLNDNFFDLGGDSLLMGRLQIKLSSVLGEQINIVDLFQYPTIKSFTEFLNQKKNIKSNTFNKDAASSKAVSNDVAIIGISGRYPKAKNIREFWENLINGIEAITFFDDEELEIVPNAKTDSELKFVKARGVLEDADKFDAEFFGYNPREASVMDPQHRIFLECAWEALEDAGYVPEKFNGSIGIFAGSSLNTYLMYNVLSDRQKQVDMANSYQLTDYTTLTGNDNGFLTTKIAYKLGLKGPAINLQTACSTSLVATAQAYQSLISGQCDMVLSGGVSVSFPQKRGYYFVDGSIGSADGHCRPFDEAATGTVFSSGAGVIVMKRLNEAIRDRDSIYAVIKSVAVNNDGSNKAGYMAPSIDGQAEVIAKAQQLAGINADTVKYVEAHGTATPVGDPIEITALEKAFRLTTDKKRFCGIGTVKSNLGHSDAAAGITGVIKTALSLKNGIIPPTLHFTKPNPRFDFNNSPFFVVDKLTKLQPSDQPIRAGVSSFGVGGTNAHAILEQFIDKRNLQDDQNGKYLFVISGKTESALKHNVEELKNYLNHNQGENPGDVAYTLQIGRHEFEWRQFVTADSIKKTISSLESVLESGLNKNKIDMNNQANVIFMFPGQGAQYVNMGYGLYKTEKYFATIVNEAAEILKPFIGLDILELMFPEVVDEAATKKLEQTVYTQPALFILEYALAKLLMSYGIKPSAMIGHSVGEYVAACLSDVLSLKDALFILSRRAKLMQEQVSGSMLSVRTNEKEIRKLLDDNNDEISIAAINSPNLIVLSGDTKKIQDLSDKLKELKIENKFLFTSHAYHSQLMEPAISPFINEFSNISLNKPTIPFISGLTGIWISDEQAMDPSYWAAQLRNTIRFSDGIKELQKKKDVVLLELGPGRALSTMASQHKKEYGKQFVISTLTQPNEDADDYTNVLNAMGRLWITGVSIEWQKLNLSKERRRVHLPTYQFDRKSYWIEPPKILSEKNDVNEKQLIKKQRVKKVIQENTMTRKEYIISILQESLEELSGIKKSELDKNRTFLELGFDSLFMTQVSLAFQKKFGIKITLRQLLETQPTLSAISGFIDSSLPPGKFEPPKQEVIVEDDLLVEDSNALPFGQEALTKTSNISVNGSVEELIYEQLELMKKQLQLLGLQNNVSSLHTEKKVSESIPVQNKSSKDLDKHIGDNNKKDEKKVFERFGPYKPIETKKGGKLTEQQQKYLNKLISDYNKKTPTSKKMTQEHRSHYSDPRTVSGFLPLWKEMTYQIITKASSGSKLIDVDNNEYIDVIMGFGQYLFGHNPKFIKDVITEQLDRGFEIGPQSPIAGEVAKLICEFTGMDRAAFCVTGSEAVLGAMRAARTVTGKDKIVFFAGDYHGIIDEVLIKTKIDGDNVKSMPIAPGIPAGNVQSTIALEYGTEESLQIIEKLLPELAAVMIEPVQSRRLDLQPKEFLLKLRKITEEANVPLIFDEVITGFRTAPGGAQEFYGIKADLATYGKVIGGGFPIGVIAGKKLYMDAFDGGYWQYGDDSIPEAGVTFFAGTFARHPLSLSGALASLNYLKDKKGTLQQTLNKNAAKLADELNFFMHQRNVPIRIINFSSVLYYSYPKDLSYFSLLFYVLRHKGLHILEGFPFFLSEAHSDDDIKFIINVFKESVIELQDNGFFPAPLNNLNGNNDQLKETYKEKKSPLADAQKEIWLAVQMSDNASCAYNESGNLELRGKLDFEALSKSIKKIIDKHEALRTTFSADGKYQIISDKLDFNLEQIDLSNLAEDERTTKLNDIISNEPKKSFDLVKGPLFRIYLIKLHDEEFRLIITAHHIICDGWSFDVMVKDLSKIYSDFVLNKIPAQTTPMQMHEYVEYIENFKNSDEYKIQEKFWLNLLKSPLTEIELPVDKERSSTRTFNGARVTREIESELFFKVKNLGIQNKTTLFTTMFSFFYILLHKLTGERDIIVGIPAAGQQVVGADDLVGHCTNLLPIRSDVDPQKSFLEFIKELKSLVLDAYENQQITYGDIVSKLRIKRKANRSPLLSTMFNIDPAIVGLNFSGLQSEIKVNPRAGYQFELGFNIVVYENYCEVECDYNSDLFTSEKIEEFINYYKNIIDQIVVNNNIQIGNIQILNNNDLRDILNLINGSN